MMIKKHDTNGTKSLLTEGEFGYDKQGLDRGRVYIGTNTGNTALAKKSEVDSKINSSLAGVSNGIATLGSDGKLTSSQMPTSVLGSLVYDGVWDASTNTPIIQLASALNSGHYYKVSISGFTNIDGISEWNVGDWIISNGVSWDKIDNTDSITSVNGMSGAVVLTKNDIGLGNLTNILDSQRCVLSATKLSTARNINGVPFDGTTDINIATVDAYTKTETNACLALKQNNLVSGTNIKTVNGSSILGSGNITIASGGTWGSITGTVSSQTDLQSCFNSKQNSLVSGTNIKTINGTSILGSGDLTVSGSGVSVDGTTLCNTSNILSVLPSCDTKWNNKQNSLVSGTSIKTVNGSTLLGSGDIVIAGGGTTYAAGNAISLASDIISVTAVCDTKWSTDTNTTYSADGTTACMTGTVLSVLPACVTVWNGKQSALVSGTSIKTINSTSMLGSGDISVQSTLVSGTNIKTINGTSILGSGDLVISGSSGTTDGTTLCTTSNVYSILPACNTKWNGKQDSLVSGTSIKTINGTSILGSGNISVQSTLVSGTNIKTVNGNTLLGSGDIVISGGSGTETLGTAIASAATTSISAAGANSVHITGITTITSLGTGTTGQTVKVIFDGALILTHNDTSLMNISNANITTAAGDTAVFLLENGASGYWRMLSYTRKDGTALVPPKSVPIAKCLVNTASPHVNAIVPIVVSNSNILTTCITTAQVNSYVQNNLILCATGSGSQLRMQTFLTSSSMMAYKTLTVNSSPGFTDCTCVTSTAGNVYRDYTVSATTASTLYYTSKLISSYGCADRTSYVNSINGACNTILTNSGTLNSTLHLGASVGGTTNNTKRAMTCIASLSSTAAATVVCIESCQVSGSGSGVSCIEMKSPTIKLIGLPTTNPGVSGALWNNNGVLNIVP